MKFSYIRYSVISTSRALSRQSAQSALTQTSAERSSIWEASTFYSRAQTAATIYHTKSGKAFLPSSLHKDCESEMNVPMIESDLNVLPKDNLCVLDSSDPELEYKLANAAVHGLAVFLKNSERYEFKSKLVEILIERDFHYDVVNNKEFIKFDDSEILLNPSFKLILHVNAPLCSLSTGNKNNRLFHRLTAQTNAAHFLVDFTPSSGFVANDFLATIMEFEKYGYGNQLNLADKILFDAEFNIFNRQVCIVIFNFNFFYFILFYNSIQ